MKTLTVNIVFIINHHQYHLTFSQLDVFVYNNSNDLLVDFQYYQKLIQLP